MIAAAVYPNFAKQCSLNPLIAVTCSSGSNSSQSDDLSASFVASFVNESTYGFHGVVTLRSLDKTDFNMDM